MLIRILGLSLFLGFFGCVTSEEQKAGMHRLAGIYNFDSNYSNRFEHIGEVYRSSNVLALGEQHHTSRGFYQIKAGIIKYLIEKKGLRRVAWEDNWTSMLEVNEYLQGKRASLREALSKMHAVWHAETILELLTWMRKFNDDHRDDPIIIFGFDIQDKKASEDYIETKSNPIMIDVAKETIKSFDIREKTSKDDMDKRNLIRDKAMASIFLKMKIALGGEKKVVIWAANGHIHKFNHSVKEQASMGFFLDQSLHSQYKAIWLVASRYDTMKKWHFLTPGQHSAPPGSLEAWMESFGFESLFIDFSKVNHRSMEMSEEDFRRYNPTHSIDGAIYLKHSTAAKSI